MINAVRNVLNKNSKAQDSEGSKKGTDPYPKQETMSRELKKSTVTLLPDINLYPSSELLFQYNGVIPEQASHLTNILK